jgi:DNA repair protein RadC
MARNPKETYRVLFLDERDHLISDEILAEGVENWVNVSIRETARRGLLLGATAIIIVHNHPSGNSSPSESDLLMTRKLQAALKILGICVHDHVIIGNGQVCSLLQLNFFEP